MAVALLVAAGSGERLGASRPKAFVALAGRPMLEWSLDALRAAGIARRRRRPAATASAAPDGLRRRARAARPARRRCAPRSPRRATGELGGRPRRRAAAGAARAVHARRWRALDGRGLRDRRRAGDRHGQGGRRRPPGRGDARPLAAVGDPDAAGVPPRGAGARARRPRRRRSPARPTTPGSSSARAARVRVVASPPGTSRSRRPHDLSVAEFLLRGRAVDTVGLSPTYPPLAVQSVQRVTQIATTGPSGGRSRYCG